MILIAGIPSEAPVALAIEAAETCGIGHYVLDQRQHHLCKLTLKLDRDLGWEGTLDGPAGPIALAAFSGVYVRLMDERFLPDVVATPARSIERIRAARFHNLFHDWLNIAPVRVASRPRAMLSNMSKTYQATLIRKCGLAIPETLVTNDPAAALDFAELCAAQGDEIIFKSVSGVRSIVQTFGEADRARIAHIRWCPTQFQRRVRGYDVRVHVIGQQTFATRIESSATDYRYAQRQTGDQAELSAWSLEPSMAGACIRLAASLDLPFAGIDLRFGHAGEVVCFEVNPCPAYSYYEDRTGAPIASALIDWLSCQER